MDGTNTTPNSGRIQINLKPREERKASASDIIRRLSDKLTEVPGITLYMQAVQDISVETQVSRTQYQYTMESVHPEDLDTWVPLFIHQAADLLPAILRDVATDKQDESQAAAGSSSIATLLYRLGLFTTMIDNTLYDAFGQRLASIMFTQLNQYHVVLEVAPEFRKNANSLSRIVREVHQWQRGCRLSAFVQFGAGHYSI